MGISHEQSNYHTPAHHQESCDTRLKTITWVRLQKGRPCHHAHNCDKGNKQTRTSTTTLILDQCNKRDI